MRIVWDAAALRQLRESLGHGVLAVGLAVETAWKADVVVAGGHRSTMTGPKTKKGTARIGGTLRRSIHTVAYVDGRRIAAGSDADHASGLDANRQPVPEYAHAVPIQALVGTNSGYGLFVELGTRKMAARPAGVPALMATRSQAQALFDAGRRRHLRNVGR